MPLDMSVAIQMIMFAVAVVICLVSKPKVSDILNAQVFGAGMTAMIALFGIAWLADTFISAHLTEVVKIMGNMVTAVPVTFAVAIFIVAALTTSQAATTRTIVPIGLGIPGLDVAFMVAMWPAVQGVLFLRANGTQLAAAEIDKIGTTKIGKDHENEGGRLVSGESDTEQTAAVPQPMEETRPAPDPGATPTDAGARMPRWIPRLLLLLVLTALGTLAFVYALGRLTGFIGTLVVALFASFALEPAVNWLARHGWKRGLATLVVMLAAAIMVVLIVAAMVPLMVRELQALILAIPGWVAEIDPLLQRWFGTSISEAAASSQSQQLLSMLAGWGANVAGNLLGLVGDFVGAVFQIFTVALFAFYLIADGPKVRRAVLSMVRPRTQREVLRTWDVAIEKTGGYLYSRMLLAAVSAVFTFVMMTILRLPFAIPLAIFVGLVSQFIPTVGTYIAAALPVLLALLHSPTKAIALLIFFVVYQQIENYLFAPRVTAHTMNMHAAVAFGSVIVGAALFGALGAFLAIPGAAILQALLWTSLSRYEVVADGLTCEAPAGPGGSTGGSLWQRLATSFVGKRGSKKDR